MNETDLRSAAILVLEEALRAAYQRRIDIPDSVMAEVERCIEELRSPGAPEGV